MCNPRTARVGRGGLGLLAGLLLAGCSLIQSAPQTEETIAQVAVLPFAIVGSRTGDQPTVPAGAGAVVTAQVYDVLASSPKWRFVPDLAVAQALATRDKTASQADQGRALGRAVKADAVLTGVVTRYVQRVGSDYGATRPASVAFEMQLVSVNSGAVLWHGSFDQTQEPLAWNLLNWWQFWAAGPRFMTVEELSHLGVERLMDELGDTIQWE